MTFEWSSEHLALRDRARGISEAVRPHAAAIDRTASIPDELVREAAVCATADGLALVVATEELAVSSAAFAMVVMLSQAGAPLGLSGLRGARQIERSTRAQAVLAAVALGVGRAALEAMLQALKGPMAPDAATERPHWVAADAATDLDAARLLTFKAARSAQEADVALARLMATGAARTAVDAALRICGVAALQEGSTLDRLARDVRALSVVLGTEEDHRAAAADALFPAR